MKIRVRFEPRDIWVGLYWNHYYEHNFEFQRDFWEFYICLIPCLPIFIQTKNRG